MTRTARRHRSWHHARRAQRIHLRQAHPDGAVDCVCERASWFFEKRKVSRHRHHCPYCHPKAWERAVRARLARFMAAHGAMPPRWWMNPKWTA